MDVEAKTRYVRAATTGEVEEQGYKVATVEGHSLAIFHHDGGFYAIDNRCPHMGFPLHRGTVADGILTCHWHHARFELCTGGTFDLFADDVRSFPVDVRDGEIWVDVAPTGDPAARHRKRLRDGLEHVLPLVIAKAVVALDDLGTDPSASVAVGVEFGTRYRQRGWFQGLTMLSCFASLVPRLDAQDRSRALYHGLSAVARDCVGQPPRFDIGALPTDGADATTLKRWLRRFVETRDLEGVERCIVSAVRGGADASAMTDMLLAAATDHRFIDAGHTADFTNAAIETLELCGWEHAERVLASLARSYAFASRAEESQSWRHPVDVVTIEEAAFDELPKALEAGRDRSGTWDGRDDLVPVLLGDDPQAIADALLAALADGATPEELASSVVYASALRIAQFPTSNEFGDWDEALHSFSFANAIHQSVRRAPSAELVRGIFDAAMTVYLNRFLNAPAAPLPEPEDRADEPEAILRELPGLFDRQAQVKPAGELVARYLYGGGAPDRLIASLGSLLVREDRDFHSIQTVAAAVRQFSSLGVTDAGVHMLVAAARYLAAHAPTVRSEDQTFRIAWRLHRGEDVYED